MDRSGVSFVLIILLLTGCGRGGHSEGIAVTYIGNEGFMVDMGGTKVLIDALSRSEYYLSPSDSIVAKLVGAIPPFDNVDYVLVTHDHPDHFDADMVSRFLQQHQSVRFIANGATYSKLTLDGIAARHWSRVDLDPGRHRVLRDDKAEVLALRLAHGGNPDISNLAFLVRANGFTIMHVGDARLSVSEEYLRTVDWTSYSVDLLFIQYFDHSSETQSIIKDLIRPGHVVLMHIPGGEEETVRREEGGVHPRTVVFEKEGDAMRFDPAAVGGSAG